MLTILNDTHLGVSRSAGTTVASKEDLTKHTQDKFLSLLPTRGSLMILGDLFDSHTVSPRTLLFTYNALGDWLERTSATLYLVAGNHDLHKATSEMSSFDLLCSLLQTRHGNVEVVKGRGMLTYYGYVIPHMPNQDLFDLALSRVPECQRLFVHCNIDNGFAAQSDHSLNMSLEQIAACPAKQIVCAHEHHARNVGKVVIPGNQIATSVADWLGDGDKFYAVIEDDFTLHLKLAAKREDEFEELHWKALEPCDKPFIRIFGEATAAEGAEALAAVAAYRRKSDALVVANGVKIQAAEGERFEEAVADMKGFDVMAMLRDVLEPGEVSKLEGLK